MAAEQSTRLPWHIDAEKAAQPFPDLATTTIKHGVYHRYKDIYYSTPYHKEWDFLPSELLFRIWAPNATLAVEQLALFFQAVMGPPAMLPEAATQFLNTLTWPKNPENEDLAALARAFDHILASNGGVGGTITVARPATGYPDTHRQPVYVRFQKDVADTSVDVPRYPDGDRVDERGFVLDLGLLRSARRIQAAAASPPVEIELAVESYSNFDDGDLGLGLTIRDEPTLDQLYRERGEH